MSSLESSNSPQLKLIQEWRQAFDKRDISVVTKTLHKDYRHITYPRSLGRPERTREEWLEHLAGVSSVRTEFEPTIHSIIDIPGKVIVHATNRTKTSLGDEINCESIFTVHIVTDEDGSLKIKKIEDFADSKTYLNYLQAIAAAKAREQ